MSQIEGPNVIAGYDIETALSLLGPIDYLPGEEISCMSRLCNVIINIWITIQRIFTYIFGDRYGRHQWYNNQAAFDIVQQYCTHSHYYEGTFPKINALYQGLGLRIAPSQNTSYANTLGPQIAAFFREAARMPQRHPHQNAQTEHVSGTEAPTITPDRQTPSGTPLFRSSTELPIMQADPTSEENPLVLDSPKALDPHFAAFFNENAFSQFDPKPVEMIDDIPSTDDLAKALNSESIILYIPKLIDTTRKEIYNFISRYLHQFITGKINKDNAPANLPGLSQILYNQIQANEAFRGADFQHVQELAFNEFIERTLQGFFTNQRNFLEPEEKEEKRFTDFLDSLKESLPNEFPNFANVSTESLKTVVKQALSTINTRVTAILEEGGERIALANNHRRLDQLQIMAFLEENNARKSLEEQSWFLPQTLIAAPNLL
jgi:hypothetical protein